MRKYKISFSSINKFDSLHSESYSYIKGMGMWWKLQERITLHSFAATACFKKQTSSNDNPYFHNVWHSITFEIFGKFSAFSSRIECYFFCLLLSGKHSNGLSASPSTKLVQLPKHTSQCANTHWECSRKQKVALGSSLM